MIDVNNALDKEREDRKAAEERKLNKTNAKNIVYGTDASGKQQLFSVQKQAYAGDGIVQRTGNGNVVVPYYPGADDCATSKQYVDNAIKQAITNILTEEF